MRMFAAVVPPQDVLDELEEFLDPRQEAPQGSAELRWTRPESWHLTLAFMADVPQRSLDDLLERLARAGRRRDPFTLRLAGGGAFPNPGRAKVFYAGVEAAADDLEELRRLSTGARAAAAKSGASADGATFRPHLTLARMRRPVEATRWLRVLSTYRSRAFEVTDFALVESHLGQGPGNRPRYDVVGSFELGKEGVDRAQDSSP
jgi:RNA 2',3'-cyclic 3'-phosphodiesterase